MTTSSFAFGDHCSRPALLVSGTTLRQYISRASAKPMRQTGLIADAIGLFSLNDVPVASPVLGGPAAVVVASALVERGTDCLIFIGTCAALDFHNAALPLGSVVCPQTILSQTDNEFLSASESTVVGGWRKLLESATAAKPAAVWSCDRPDTQNVAVCQAAAERGATVVEMELEMLNRFSAEANVPLCAGLVVTDSWSSNGWKTSFKHPTVLQGFQSLAQALVGTLSAR